MDPVSEFPSAAKYRCSDLSDREAQAFVLVYSVTSRASFEGIGDYYKTLIRIKGGLDPIFILVGNKSDQLHEREVSIEEGAALARRLRCPFLETSAKRNINIHKVFEEIVCSLRKFQGIELGTRTIAQPAKLKCIIM